MPTNLDAYVFSFEILKQSLSLNVFFSIEFLYNFLFCEKKNVLYLRIRNSG